jgi:hypothetical protein
VAVRKGRVNDLKSAMAWFNIHLLIKWFGACVFHGTIIRRKAMWRISIGPFGSKDEAEYWKASKVKRKDIHPAVVEEVKEEHPDRKYRRPTD